MIMYYRFKRPTQPLSYLRLRLKRSLPKFTLSTKTAATSWTRWPTWTLLERLRISKLIRPGRHWLFLRKPLKVTSSTTRRLVPRAWISLTNRQSKWFLNSQQFLLQMYYKPMCLLPRASSRRLWLKNSVTRSVPKTNLERTTFLRKSWLSNSYSEMNIVIVTIDGKK